MKPQNNPIAAFSPAPTRAGGQRIKGEEPQARPKRPGSTEIGSCKSAETVLLLCKSSHRSPRRVYASGWRYPIGLSFKARSHATSRVALCAVDGLVKPQPRARRTDTMADEPKPKEGPAPQQGAPAPRKSLPNQNPQPNPSKARSRSARSGATPRNSSPITRSDVSASASRASWKPSMPESRICTAAEF